MIIDPEHALWLSMGHRAGRRIICCMGTDHAIRDEIMLLRDGRSARVRTPLPADRDAVRAFFEGIKTSEADETLLPGIEGPETLADLLTTTTTPTKLLALLVTHLEGEREVILAVGSYRAQKAEREAGIALAVADEHRGLGIATRLLDRLARLAAHHGFEHFRATAHESNDSLLQLLRGTGLVSQEVRCEGWIEVDLEVANDEDSRALRDLRERVDTTRSLRPFFHPRAVAVVGASRNPKSLGYRILEQLFMNRFRGPVYVVNPNAEVVGSFRTWPTIQAIPGPVDLAIVVVPGPHVESVVDDAAAAGVKALVVITAGFAEVDDEGRERQARLRERVRGHGMRMIGPNCMGILNLQEEVRMNASFGPVAPKAGRVAMLSQSGALGLAILNFAQTLDIGLSTFVSIGNKADVSGNDLLQYWEDDDQTDVCLLYLESFGNPRRFARIARRVSHRKPIVAVKGGRTGAGQRAAGSHTAALAGSDTAVQALFQQTGVIRADTLEEMFDLALVLSTQPLPPGRRVAVLTNAGGPAILAADAMEAEGLEVAELSDETQAELQAFLPKEASTKNPVDMIASASPDQYRQAAEILLSADEVDALIVIDAPLDKDMWPAIAAELMKGIKSGRARSSRPKPILACVMGSAALTHPVLVHGDIPAFPFPEAPARALSKVLRYAQWCRTDVDPEPRMEGVDTSEARSRCRKLIAEQGAGWLEPDDVRLLLESVRLPWAGGRVARTADEAVDAARSLEGPVAAKLVSSAVLHKSDRGGVKLDLATDEDVHAAFTEMQQSFGEEMEGLLVQPMVAGGTELMAGMASDPVFGPVLAFGLGGVHVEVLRDVVFRITPLSRRDAEEMVDGIRGRKLLDGFRGASPADKEAIVDLLLRLSQLVEEIPEIDEVDLNPFFALTPGSGCRIVDARIHIAPPAAR